MIFAALKTKEAAIMNVKTEYVTSTPRCLQIVAKLEHELVIAVATEGVNVNKEQPITLLQIGTCSGRVYLFDFLVNRELISKGRLRVILENHKIVKVMQTRHLSHVMRKPTFWFPTWSDINQAVQLQKMARGLKFRI